MTTKEMTLCKVRLVWKREEVKNYQGKTIFGPTAEYEGFYAVESIPGEHPFTKQRQKAAQLALEDVVGPPEYQEKVGAKVVSVKVLGLVMVKDSVGADIDEILSIARKSEKVIREVETAVNDINELLDGEGIKSGSLTNRVKELISDNKDLRKQIEDQQR